MCTLHMEFPYNDIVLETMKKYIIHRDFSHESKVRSSSSNICKALEDAAFSSFNREDRLLLDSAAALHDIGYFINKKGHQHHSSYLLRNDVLLEQLPEDLRFELAFLCENHRKNKPIDLSKICLNRQSILLQLIAVLRLADVISYKHVAAVEYSTVAKDTIFSVKVVLTMTAEMLNNSSEAIRFYNKLWLKSELARALFQLDIKISSPICQGTANSDY